MHKIDKTSSSEAVYDSSSRKVIELTIRMLSDINLNPMAGEKDIVNMFIV